MSIEGKRVALTGKLARISRSDATSQLEDLGAEVTAVVETETDLVIAGSDSGSRIDDAIARGLPVLDEAALERLLAGQPLASLLGRSPSAAARIRPPLPAIEWARDGVYRRVVDGALRTDGHVVAGRMHATWCYRGPTGQPIREVELLDGLEHGREHGWTAAGMPAYRGAHERGRRCGVWESFHADGITVATHTEYRDGVPHGAHREYARDGALRVSGQHVAGKRDGVWMAISADGTRVEHRYLDGFPVATPSPIDADRDAMDKVVRAVRKAKQRWEKEAALEAIASEGNRFVLVHLMRLDVLDVASEPGLWELLADAAADLACAITGTELMDVLARISPKQLGEGGHLERWPASLDRAVCHVLLWDPAPFERWRSLAPPIARGVASALVRAGRADASVLEDVAHALAHVLVASGPLAPIPWFDEGRVVMRALVEETATIAPTTTTTPTFDALIALYTTHDAWAAASLARALGRGVKAVALSRLRAACAIATVPQLTRLLQRADRVEDIAAAVVASRLPIEELTRLALAQSDGPSRQTALLGVLVRCGLEGVPVPARVVDAVSFVAAVEPDAARVHRALEALPLEHRDEPAVRAALLRRDDEPFPFLPRLEEVLLAARALGDELETVLRRDLRNGDAMWVAPLLTATSPAFWDEALPILAHRPLGHEPGVVGAALGSLSPAALEAIAHAHDAAASADARTVLASGAVAVMARAEAWDARHDRFLQVALADSPEERAFVSPLLCAAIHALPTERAEAVLLANLDPARREVFARAFALVGLAPTPAVMTRALHGVIDLESTLLDGDLEHVASGLAGLFEPDPWMRWLLAAGAGGRLGSALVEVAGNEEKLEALHEEVEATGARVTHAIDSIDVIAATAARLAEASNQTVYLLRVVDEQPSDAGYNRIGGVPVGVTTRKWPKRRGKPMTHLFTLDVETMPALAKHLGPDARTVSLFVASPEHHEATSPGNDWAKVVIVSPKDAAKGELAPPPAAIARPMRWFEPVPVDVPAAVFSARAGTLRELRDELAKHPRVLGAPSWPGAPVHAGRLLAQFGPDFVDVELGDDGVMYVFEDTAFALGGARR